VLNFESDSLVETQIFKKENI